MNAIIERILEEVHSAWRFRWIGVSTAAIVAVLGWIVVFVLPDRYEARGSVFVDTRTALKPVLQGLTVEQDVNVQLNYVRQSLLSGERLERIARSSGVLGAEITEPREVARILTDFGQSVALDVRSAGVQGGERDAAGSVYTFKYQDNSRDVSLKVLETVLNSFVDETLGGKRAGSESAQRFLEAQIKIYEERLRDAENRRAEFKKNNIGLMPTEQGGYFQQLQSEIDLTKKLEADLGVAESRRRELSRQLRGDVVIGATTAGPASGSAGAMGGDTVTRIKDQQAKLDELLLRFTDKHPDVVAARTTLDELQRRREAEIESLRKGDANAVASSGVSANPVFQSIQLQLNQTDVEIASLRNQVAQHRAKAAELRKRLDTAPKVEAELSQLDRDYEINKAQYTSLLANYEKASLGERADDAGSVRFEVVQPPTAPFGPVSPKRNLLLAGVLAAAMVLGAAVCYLLHMLNPVVSSLRGLAELTELPVLGAVSGAFPDEAASRARSEIRWFLAAMAMFVIAFGAVVIANRLGVRLYGIVGAG